MDTMILTFRDQCPFPKAGRKTLSMLSAGLSIIARQITWGNQAEESETEKRVNRGAQSTAEFSSE